MLKLTVTLSENYNESTNEFEVETLELEMEHSLVSLSKWESRFEKPFLGPDEKTDEEIFFYIECMILTPDFPPEIVKRFSKKDFEKINDYLVSKQSATWFTNKKDNSPSRETITSELIYYWLSSYQIPREAERWHLNRLLTLIRVFNAKNEKPKKRSSSEIAAERRALNEKRRREMKTHG